MPKSAATRQRRNKATTRALLPAETVPMVEYPALPDRKGDAWHPLTTRWWNDVWTSPLHHEFLRADSGALFRLANIVDAYWKTGELRYAAEIRLMEREFGLTPLARRRLEWTVAQAEVTTSKPKAGSKVRVVNNDPREGLT